MDAFLFDLRYTLRLLARSPGFTALCITVIALAISLALTIYVVVGNQGIKPLPLPMGDRYVALMLVDKPSQIVNRGDRVDAFVYSLLKQRTLSYGLLGAARIQGSVTISDEGIAESVYGTEIAAEMLNATAVKPIKGRSLNASDNELGAEKVALIGYELWQNYYAGREDIIGYRSRIDGEMHVIVGVMPAGFHFPLDHQLWKAQQLPGAPTPGDDKFSMTLIGILKPGISMAQADAEMKNIMAQIAAEYPEDYENLGGKVQNYIYAASASDWGAMNAIMLVAACAILSLACLNVGNLLLIRTNERTRELVICSALGGSRLRVVRQILLESFVICLIGGLLGLWLGSFGAEFVHYQTQIVVGSSYLPFWMNFDVGADIILLTIATTFLVWLLAGGVPAYRASQLEISSALGGGGKGVAGKGNNKTAMALVAVEVICSFFLLLLSGAFVSAVHFTSQVDYGVDTDNYVTGYIETRPEAYPEMADKERLYNDLKAEFISEPNIVAASFTNALPGMGYWRTPINIDDRDLKNNGQYPLQIMIPIDRDYFKTMDIKVLVGRHFGAEDVAESMPVVIVEKAFADTMWPGESALGKRIHINPEDSKLAPPTSWATIIGVVEHIDQGQSFSHYKGLTSIYQPFSQQTQDWTHFVVKYSEKPRHFETQLKKAASRVDRDTPLRRIRPMEESLFTNTRIMQSLSELFLLVALVAVVLAGTGIYGVISRNVLLRTHEMGVRRALGWSDANTVLHFIKQGAVYLLIGTLVGGGGALIASNLLTGQFPNLLNGIAGITVFIILLMTALIFVASYLPARKIVNMEPAEALRHA